MVLLLVYRRTQAEGNHSILCAFLRAFRRARTHLVDPPTAISNYRQNSLQGVFKHSLFQGFQRTIAQVPYFLVPAVIGAPMSRLYPSGPGLNPQLPCSVRHNLLGSEEERVPQVPLFYVCKPVQADIVVLAQLEGRTSGNSRAGGSLGV